MTPTRLAPMLRPLKIKPTDIGPEDDRKRGYRLNEFAEAFDRYLEGGSQPCSPAGADKTGVSDDSKVRSQKTGCGPAKSQKPNENGHLWTCEVAEGVPGLKRLSAPVSGRRSGRSTGSRSPCSGRRNRAPRASIATALNPTTRGR